MRLDASGARKFALAITLTCSVASGAAADGDSCREWKREHCDLAAKTMGLFLRGAPQAEIDAAFFDLLQREAYLTSCESSVENARSFQVGWRLVDRTPDEYAGALFDSLLDRAGLDTTLSGIRTGAPPPSPARAEPPPPRAFRPTGRRAAY